MNARIKSHIVSSVYENSQSKLRIENHERTFIAARDYLTELPTFGWEQIDSKSDSIEVEYELLGVTSLPNNELSITYNFKKRL